MQHALTRNGYGTLALAIIAWLGVFYLAGSIASANDARAANAAVLQQRASTVAVAAQFHAVARSVQPFSAQMDGILHEDVASIANTIQAAGASAGVTLKISDALPEDTGTTAQQSGVHALGFVIETSGTFANCMRAIALFESLPIASEIESVDLAPALRPPLPAAALLPGT